MVRKHFVKDCILVFSLSTALALGGIPSGVFAAENTAAARETIDQTGAALDMAAFTLGAKAAGVDNGRGGQAIKITTSWVSSSESMAASAAFADGSIFKKDAFTLYADVYRQVIATSGSDDDSQGRNVTFSVGEENNYFKICLSAGGSLRYKSAGGEEKIQAFNGSTEENKWNALAVSYSESEGTGKVTVYIEGKKVLEQIDTGFALSGLSEVKANIGAGFGTGFMGKGLYDNIRVEDAAVTSDTLEVAKRYMPYSTFSGSAEGILCSGNVQVNEWLDTSGEHIQAHGGQVQWLDTLDLDEDGIQEGGWIWYGEDKTRNGKPIDGIHCYTSPDLYNWTDQGMALSTHDVIPDKLNVTSDGITQNTEGLTALKTWAEMTEPTGEVTQEEITMAKTFLAAYRTEDGYDEVNLAKAFKYLYSGYCIAERPKMLYNESTKQYVLVYHVDGPSDANILKYLQDGIFPSRYTRAMMGFAVSDTPYGPFKLVNAQRMNYRTGDAYAAASSPGMSRDMTVFLDDTDIDKDGVKDAYAIYSSEDNKFMYVSLLNSDYTGPATEGIKDTKTLTDGTTVQTFADRVLGSAIWREAPAVFKYNGCYYMITSGTTGWMANAAVYYRAENIYGPWTAMGDPCEGTSKDTFGSQPTAVIPVNAEKGQFIYMGDRWSYTILDSSNNTDSAHWDSGYVWCPISIGEDNTICVQNLADWDLSALEKVQVNTSLPGTITSMDELPSRLNVTYQDKTMDTDVVWNQVELENFTVQEITGTLSDLNDKTISVQIAAAPKNIVYFVDAGADGKLGRVFYNKIAENGTLKNITAPDQPYTAEGQWGYVGNNTTRRNLSSGNMYELLRYINDANDRNLIYQFDGLEEGSYTVHIGLFDPASWYKGNRVANISVKEGSTVLKTGEAAFSNGTENYVTYDNLNVKGTDALQVVLEPKNTGEGADMQVSWIAIEDNTVRGEGDKPGDGDTDEGDKPGEGNTDESDKSGTGTPDENGKPNADITNGNENGQTGNNGADIETKEIPAEKLTLSSKKLYLVKGKSINIKAVMKPVNTTDKLTWSSSKTSVATVKNGKITAKKTGNATITVKTDSGKKATCKVYVVKKAQKSSSIKLNTKKVTIQKGNWYLLTPTLKPAKSTDTVKWKSSNSKVASVDAYGFVTGKKKGTATITATAKSGKKAQCKVTVR